MNFIKRKLTYFFPLIICLVCIGMLNKSRCKCNNPDLPALDKTNKIVNTSPKYDEVILFCGNPRSGKSTLFNSIFQAPIFSSGISPIENVTQEKQAHIYANRKYIDTPGLWGSTLNKQAAKEIEKALKENNNYKIVFVTALNSSGIRVADLITINTICETIKTPFEYGIIFNKLTKNVLKEVQQNRDVLANRYLNELTKAPASYIFIEKNQDLEDEDNVYLSVNSESRKKLLDFIDNLPAKQILADQVHAINLFNLQERKDRLETKINQKIEDEIK